MKKISYLFVLSLSALCFSSCTPSNGNTITPSESIIPETQVNEDGKPIHNSHNIDSHNTDSGNTGSGTTGTLSDDINAYYATITDSMSGDTLKSKLSDIITNGHSKYNYDNLEIAMRTTDRDWSKSPDPKDENPYMHLLYLVDNQNKPKLWNTSQGSYGTTENGKYTWNKEHIWAKSNGFNSKGCFAYSDLHHLRASDWNNNVRSNNPFGTVSSGTNVKDFDGNNSGKVISNTIYEPQNCDKGDVARALFYMATRYCDGDGSKGTCLALTNGTDKTGGKWGYLSTLLQWHLQDPPDEFEKHRNDLIYEQFQHNRNPFIDHPEYASRIWG